LSRSGGPILAAVVALSTLVSPVRALSQGSGILVIPGASDTAPAAPPPSSGIVEDAPAQRPYDAQLLRLAEILGALHYLRGLCGSGEGTLWRDQMQGIIESESPDDVRKSRLIARFNLGYESFRAVYRTCTAAATTAVERYIEEGAQIARDIGIRYGREK